MDELGKLMQQKKEIEDKIRMLKNQTKVCGMAKIDIERYATAKPDRHFLAIYYRPLDNGRAKWQTVFSANDRASVVAAIPEIVSNLQTLYATLNEAK